MGTKIEEQVRAGKVARSLIDLIDGEAAALSASETAFRHFLTIMRQHAVERYEEEFGKPVDPAAPMTAGEIAQFEKMKMKFGKHMGVAVGNVPIGYLQWLNDEYEKNPFEKNLDRYLKATNRAKVALDADDEDDWPELS